MKRGKDEEKSLRFAVNAWDNKGDRIGPENLHDTYDAARDAARKLWVGYKGKLRVTVFDEYVGVVLWRLDPGEIEVADPLLCHDPAHVNPAHDPTWVGERRRSKKR